MKDIEIEIQAQVESIEGLREFLKQNATFVSKKQQVDEYFVPAHRNFLDVNPIQEWFRLRNEGGVFSMNYKKWHYDNKGIGQYADEFETKIEDIESARKIISALDVKSIVVVDKTREKWMYKDYEVALDTVVDLGDFVEIEYKSKEIAEPKEVTQAMVKFLKEQKCGKILLQNGGYPHKLLRPEEVSVIEA